MNRIRPGMLIVKSLFHDTSMRRHNVAMRFMQLPMKARQLSTRFKQISMRVKPLSTRVRRPSIIRPLVIAGTSGILTFCAPGMFTPGTPGALTASAPGTFTPGTLGAVTAGTPGARTPGSSGVLTAYAYASASVDTPTARANADTDATHTDAGESGVEVIRHVPTKDKMVALTFDDGPSDTFTPQILELLKDYHAKATFFVIGSRIERYPHLIRGELALHNEIANHSYSHILLQGVSALAVYDELSKEQHAMMVVTGHEASHLFRPPRGRFGRSVLDAARESGYKIVLWSVDSRDWDNPGTAYIVRHVLKNTKSGDILLFHDQGGNRQQTVSALRAIIPELEHRGFQFVTVTELLQHADKSGHKLD